MSTKTTYKTLADQLSRHAMAVLVLVLLAGTAWAQNVKFTASAPKSVATGQRFQVTYTLNTSEGTNFSAPQFTNFQALSGPNHQTSMQWINGQMSSSISYSYVLKPVKVGTFRLEPATVKVNGKTHKSNSVQIQVVKGKQVQPQNAQGGSGTPDLKNHLYMKLITNKRELYVGEQMLANYKLFSRVTIVGSGETVEPKFTGFWSEQIEVANGGQLKNENVDGVPHSTAELQNVVLIPQRTGDLVIEPMSMDIKARIRSNKRPRSIFDSHFNFKDVVYTVTSNKAKVKVKPLPEAGKPTSFSGAVGKFDFTVKIDKDSVDVGEAIALKVQIKGTGNLNLLDMPELSFPQEFEVYDPDVKNNYKAVKGAGIRGKKTYEYVILPRHSGRFRIPGLSFSYFNPKTEEYVDIQTDDLDIIVGKGEEVAGGVNNFTPIMKEDVLVVGTDIRFIKSGPAMLQERGIYFLGSSVFYALLAAPGLFFILFLPLRRRSQRRSADTVGTKMRKANRMASKRLALAKKLLDQGEQTAFFEEILKAMYGFLSDKLNLPVSELSKERAVETLTQRGIDNDTITRMVSVLDRCEMARYAPVSDASGRDASSQVYDEAAGIIRKLEGGLR